MNVEKNRLSTPSDFHWHKVRLDLEREYEHRHLGEPKSFPCLVFSEWSDDPNGPYQYRHYFKYLIQEIVKCDHCGTEKRTTRWTENYE